MADRSSIRRYDLVSKVWSDFTTSLDIGAVYGLAVDEEEKIVFIADYGHRKIYKKDYSTNTEAVIKAYAIGKQ